MTQNQIAYFKAKEEVAHWQRSDDEVRRHNERVENLTADSNQYTQSHFERQDSETNRHNLATEKFAIAQNDIARYNAETNRGNLLEQQRHNQVGESQTWTQLAETARHNVTTEQLGVATLQEQKRHNVSSENISLLGISETGRHNRATESIDSALAASTITRNDYLNYLTHAQEMESYARQVNLGQDTVLKEAQAGKVESETDYLKAQSERAKAETSTEYFRQAQLDASRKYLEKQTANYDDYILSQEVGNYAGAFQNVTHGVSNIFSMFKGTGLMGSITNAQSATNPSGSGHGTGGQIEVSTWDEFYNAALEQLGQ